MLAIIRELDKNRFECGGVSFRFVDSDYHIHRTSNEEVIILKPAKWYDYYDRLIRERELANIFEIGIFQGGSAILFGLLFPNIRIVSIDIGKHNQVVVDLIARLGMSDRIKLYYETSQSDREKVAAIAKEEFPNGIDLVIDDASHQLVETKASFEVLFPKVRSGGAYVIEDWAWAHWGGAFQADQWKQMPALSNLIFQLVQYSGSSGTVIEGINISDRLACVLKRGPISDKLDLDAAYPSRGKVLSLI